MIRVLGRKEEKQFARQLEKSTGKAVVVSDKILVDRKEICIGTREVAAFVEHFGKQLRIEQAGLLVVVDEKKGVFSIEGAQVFAPFFVQRRALNDGEVQQWMRGVDIPAADEKGLVLLSYGNDIVGAGSVKEGKILNTVPKERRIKSAAE